MAPRWLSFLHTKSELKLPAVQVVHFPTCFPIRIQNILEKKEKPLTIVPFLADDVLNLQFVRIAGAKHPQNKIHIQQTQMPRFAVQNFP